MNKTEIEIKFFTTLTGVAALSELLSVYPKEQPILIGNDYFDTADKMFHQHKIGVRIRHYSDQHYEMTLKTAGNVVGNLHQRREFNINLDEPKLNLSLLPTNAWPEEFDQAILQQQIDKIFTTRFTRTCWRVVLNSSTVEVALDQGKIEANGQQEPIQEIELELLTGQIEDLLLLAEQVAMLEGTRLDNLSKAVRGYRLASHSVPLFGRQILMPKVIAIKPKSDNQQALISLIQALLNESLLLEEIGLLGEKRVKQQILSWLTMLRQLWSLFGGMIPRRVTSSLRTLLAELEEQLRSEDAELASICYGAVLPHLQILLMSWLVCPKWHNDLTPEHHKRLAGSFKRFADIMLSRSHAELKSTTQQWMTTGISHDQFMHLKKHIIQLYLLCGIYSKQRYQSYLATWQHVLERLEQQPIDHNKLKNACQAAIKHHPFWR